MNKPSKFEMPKIIDDGRLDLLLTIIETIKLGHDVELSFAKTEKISPAGHAILFVILDTASEQKISLKIENFNQDKLQLHEQIVQLSETDKPLKGFVEIQKLSMNKTDFAVYGKASSIAPEFIQLVEKKFDKLLDEDRLWEVTLTLNELMQNAADHSTAERYFLYAGRNENVFEFGILDMGVTIPAKLESKYTFDSDEKYLEEAFVQGVGTRRNRPGGMGLYYLFENIKKAKGRLVILSRNAQVRKNFGTRNYKTSKLKNTLFGTWCMASFPLE